MVQIQNQVKNSGSSVRISDELTAAKNETAPFTMDMRTVSTNDSELVLQSLGTLVTSTIAYKC